MTGMPATIRTQVRSEIEISRSRFITILAPASSTEAARAIVAEARAEFPDARHHCSAWIHRVDGEADREHSSDDGEPSGTAGRPMLDVLRGAGLTDTCAVVVRYFGGTLLGTGGLVRAYSDSVASAIEAAEVVQIISTPLWRFTCSPAEAGRIESLLLGLGHEVETEWSNEVTLTVSADDAGALQSLLSAELGREVDVERVGTRERFER